VITRRQAKEKAWAWADAQPDLPHGSLMAMAIRSQYESDGFRRINILWQRPKGEPITLVSLLVSDSKVIVHRDKR
jgi:hypothetical protein